VLIVVVSTVTESGPLRPTLDLTRSVGVQNWA